MISFHSIIPFIRPNPALFAWWKALGPLSRIFHTCRGAHAAGGHFAAARREVLTMGTEPDVRHSMVVENPVFADGGAPPTASRMAGRALPRMVVVLLFSILALAVSPATIQASGHLSGIVPAVRASAPEENDSIHIAEDPDVGPVITSVDPPPESIVTQLTAITITLNEPVEGFTAAAFLINGQPATSVSGSGPGPYTLEFPQPAAGPVQINRAEPSSITDSSGNPFAGQPWSYSLNPAHEDVILSEIMYRPDSENELEEYIELFNRGAQAVNLAGWRFNDGVSFTFPEVTLEPESYLVVAADEDTFSAKYPEVANVIGGWEGVLSNSGERVRLVDAAGTTVDEVAYADEGDWAVRRRGELDRNHRGWTWFAEPDGLGKSLELINPNLPNDSGQNWTAGLVDQGTPGQPNSAAVTDSAPLIANFFQFPVIPNSSDSVLVVARIIDEIPWNQTVNLFWRVDGAEPGPFQPLTMRDDGTEGDGMAGDGLYTAILPPQPNDTVVEFYLEARDAAGHSRAWPAPAIQEAGGLAQTANLLYQVDDREYSQDHPLYKIVMTENERQELETIGSILFDSRSDARMNGTFISIDGTGTEIRYLVGIRNRGHGSRNRKPNNFRVNFRGDALWKESAALNINAQFSWLQHFGAAICLKSGVAGADSRPVQLRVNNADLSTTGANSRTYGLYAANQFLDGHWANAHFPRDDNGNIYRGIRDIDPDDFNYRGEDPTAYRNTWFKSTNEAKDDWSDLIEMLRVFEDEDPLSPENLRQVIDVEQWLRHLAVMALMDNRESGLNTGFNDDYFMYRGIHDPRFILLYYDLDTIVGQPGGSNPTRTLFGATAMPAFERFMRHPEIEPLYFRILEELIETTFSQPQFDALVDQTLGDYVPEVIRQAMKDWMDQRRDYVRSIVPDLPDEPSIRAALAGAPRSPTPLTSAQIFVSGEGITHYRYQLNDAPFGAETPIDTPIQLDGLAEGTHTLSVIGRDSEGLWQEEASATSITWTVDASWPAVRINEFLADNASAFDHEGTFPDFIELYNEGPAAVDLSGMRLSDDAANPGRFVFPAGTLLPAEEYLVLIAGPSDGTSGLHTGFALAADGEGVFLFDSIAEGGELLDSVEFGPQLPGKSIGRINGGEWHLNSPTPGALNEALPLGDPEAVRINEWLASESTEFPEDFVELFNPGDLPVNLGGFFLTDLPLGYPERSRLPPLSFIGGQNFLVLIADGDATAGGNHLDFRLATEQGEIALFDPNGKRIDYVIHGPQTRGASTGRCPDGDWTQKELIRPTPGGANPCPEEPPGPEVVTLLPFDAAWKYDDRGEDLGSEWKEVAFDDSDWPSGPGLLGFETGALPEPIRTPFDDFGGKITFYFRASFEVDPELEISQLDLFRIIDDGAVFYINGEEAAPRFNLDDGPIDYLTEATSVGNAVLNSVSLDPAVLNPGTNHLAVEVHQQSPASSDIVFGLRLDATMDPNPSPASPPVINEVLAGGPGAAENDWVELYNPADADYDLSGLSLSDDFLNPRRWVFPQGATIPAHGFFTVQFDGNPPASDSNTGFGLKANGESIYLFDTPENNGQLLDSVTYGLQIAGYSIGRISDGGTSWKLTHPTPDLPNEPAEQSAPFSLAINEWMAAPTAGDDWFEIYNPAPLPVEISGMHLTDNLAEPTKFRVPELSFIGAGAHPFVLFQADDDIEQGADHTNFKLSRSGEQLGLATAEGHLITSVSFGPQTDDVSQGRFPDDGSEIISFVLSPTPGARNVPDGGAPDLDQDGLPDDWELDNGFNPDDPTDARADSDGDGLTNLEEFLAGTDPWDESSHLRLRLGLNTFGEFVLQFELMANRDYFLEYKNHVEDPNWETLTNLPAEDSPGPVEIPISLFENNHRFYRLTVQPAP